MNSWRRLIGLIGLLLLATQPATAKKPHERPMVARVKGENLHVTLSFADLADSGLRAKLKSGLPQMITTRIFIYEKGRKKPIGATVHSCRVVYDLWEEKYRVQMQDARHDLLHVDATVERVVKRCFSLDDVAVSSASGWRGKQLYVTALVEINPMSQQTVKRIRRWLAKPSGGGLGDDAFFGSFVSIFVGRDLGVAEKSAMFRSPLLRVP